MNALQEAITLITPPSDLVCDAAARQSRVDQLLREATLLLERRGTLLGVEQLAGPRIQDRLGAIRTEILTLLPTLSLEPLRWRRENGYPKLAILSLESPRMTFEVQVHAHSDLDDKQRTDCFLHHNCTVNDPPRYQEFCTAGVHPHFPLALRSFYPDVIQQLTERARRTLDGYRRSPNLRDTFRMGYRIIASFGGLIPHATRLRLQTAQALYDWQEETRDYPYRSKRRSSVYLIFEPEEWQEESVASGDPIAIIWDGENLRVLDVFDPSPLEQLVLEEFSTPSA